MGGLSARKTMLNIYVHLGPSSLTISGNEGGEGKTILKFDYDHKEVKLWVPNSVWSKQTAGTADILGAINWTGYLEGLAWSEEAPGIGAYAPKLRTIVELVRDYIDEIPAGCTQADLPITAITATVSWS